MRSIQVDRGRRRTFANDRKNSTTVWMHVATIKNTVASLTTVFNKEENRKIVTLEHANQIITPNRETSDTTHRE